MSKKLLIIFVKAPRAGFVKSRIAETIGAAAARDVYLELTDILFASLCMLENVRLHYTPADAFEEISHWLNPGWTTRPQEHGDLGQRLHSAFAGAFADAFDRVAIIGSDCPDVTQEDVQEAWDALADHDLVLGPAEDGGYWLIGLKKVTPALFENISWSGPLVLGETVAKADGLKVKFLRTLADIDTAADWKRFREKQKAGDAGIA